MIRYWLVCLNILIINSLCAQEGYKRNVFGFATSNTFTFFDVKSDDFKEDIKKITPQVLRFPGGAVGNFYHFGKSGYGFDFNEIDKYHNGKFPKRSRGLENSRKKNQHHHDYIDDFITLARKTKAKAVLVANPFVEDDNDIFFKDTSDLLFLKDFILNFLTFTFLTLSFFGILNLKVLLRIKLNNLFI